MMRKLGEKIGLLLLGSVVEFRAASTTSTKKRSCRKGIPCGGSCIAAGKKCRITLEGEEKTHAKTAKKIAPQPKAKKKVPSPSPIKPSPIKVPPLADPSRKWAIQEFGEDVVTRSEQKLAKFLKEANVHVRVAGFYTINKILKDKFKNTLELEGESGGKGILYEKIRVNVEHKRLGYPPDSLPEERPIYGYFSTGDIAMDWAKNPGVNGYGRIIIKLKSQTKERASFSPYDSFSDHSGIASPVLKRSDDADTPPPSISALTAFSLPNDDDSLTPKWNRSRTSLNISDLERATSLDDFRKKSQSPYIEAQIHGRVDANDIEAIYYKKSSSPPASTQKLANDLGIPLIAVDVDD